jgi:hypothetical protein
MKYSVESWAKNITHAKPANRANSVKTGKASTIGTGRRLGSTAPALSASGSSHPASSVLTNTIIVTNAQVPQTVKINQDTDAIYTIDGGLSDCEETAGVERAAAIASPVKGKKRLSSEVSIFFIMLYVVALTSEQGPCDRKKTQSDRSQQKIQEPRPSTGH